MEKIKVYFNQKQIHRDRQSDTVKFWSEFVEVISPLKEKIDYMKSINKPSKLYWYISRIVNNFPFINLRKMQSISNNADFIYTWWDIPFNSRKPFIVELDNPYVLTFYNYFAFKIYKPIIRNLLKSDMCKKIVCISDACRLSFLKELWEDFWEKTLVLYPRVDDYKKTIKRSHKNIRFIFIWLDPLRKWAYEMLEAFHEIDNKEIELIIIWFRDEKIEKKYKKDKRIQFLWRKSRDDILNKYFPQTDIFVFPTFHESFWIVAIEALSRWLWIITTNVYALPELVIEWKNWVILKHPYLDEVLYSWRGFVDVTRFTIGDFNRKYLEWKPINMLLKVQIKDAMKKAIKNKEIWQKNSMEIYKNKFSKYIWDKTFKGLFQ